MRIGLPRALLYYWLGPAWKVFLQEIDLTPVVSEPTNKKILEDGVRVAVDEACLPVKIFFGHCLHLIRDCDFILVPRISSLQKREYICPKFMGLPDMVQRVLGQEKRDHILIWKSDEKFFWDTPQAVPKGFFELAGKKKVKAALGKAKQTWVEYIKLLQKGYFPAQAEQLLLGESALPLFVPGRSGVGVIGHPYCLYDGFLNLDLLNLLQNGEYNYQIHTPEIFSEQEINLELSDISKPVFWTLGRRMLGAARALRKKGVAGLIHVAAFACGPEALIGELIRRECKGHDLPLLQLNIDEHSGEAGLLTRVEAFLDLLTVRSRRKEGIRCG